MLYRFLFPEHFNGKGVSILILALRFFIGVMIMLHGLQKLMNFEVLSFTFPSFFGFGSYTSLMLVIFAELCCSLFLIFGLLVRIAVIFPMITMAVAFFDVHNAEFPSGELSFLYLVILVILYFTGPGRYSLDYLIAARFMRNAAEISETLPN